MCLQAECCSDRLHCCPEGATCDIAHKRCNHRGVLIPWFEKTRSTPVPQVPSLLVCPDQQTTCQTTASCCPHPSGGFGCCPIRKVSQSVPGSMSLSCVALICEGCAVCLFKRPSSEVPVVIDSSFCLLNF